MTRSLKLLPLLIALLVCAAHTAAAQTTGSISGTVQDEKGATVAGATVTARNVETNTSRTGQTDADGRYRFTGMPVGQYEVTAEAAGFAKYVQTGIQLLLNQDAVVDATMKPAGVQEVVNVTENASLLNTSNAEVATRFDSRRLSELPLGTGQATFANGINYSSNGGRVRSNNFMIDGQDINDPSVAGGQQSINNPDIVQEVRLITNQFLPEYGGNAGSVLNIITKAGTNE